jgi:DHA1 family bicyclomycin/chloramphenicol resistance-like MFS transporter
VALLAAVTAIGFAALHMVVPVLPLLATVFGRGPAQVQLVLTLYFGGIAGGQLFYGPLSDRFGRRPVLLGGLAVFLVGTALCGLAWSLPALLLGRVLQALGACAGIVLGRAIIRDVHDREGAARGIALVMMAMTLAPAVSPAIGACLAEWFDWRAIFALLGAIGAIVLALTAAKLQESNPHAVPLDVVGMAKSYIILLRSRAFVGFAFGSAFTSASWFTFIASAPYLLSQSMDQPPSTYGVMILLPMAAYMLGNAAAVRFALRLGSVALFLLGLALSLAAGLVMTLWCARGLSVWALFVPIALSSVGNGLSQPPAVAAALSVYPRIAGTASGLVGFLQMLVSALGTLLVGFLPHGSALSMVAVVDLCLLLAMLFGIIAAAQPAPVGAQPRAAPLFTPAADLPVGRTQSSPLRSPPRPQ